MSNPNYYDILEVSPKASVEVIRAAYKSLMQRNHPDKHPDPIGSTPRAVSIAQAYEVLSDPERRLAYDRLLSAPQIALTSPRHSAGSAQRWSRKPEPSPRYQAWYACALIVCILGAGGVILRLSGKTPPAEQTTQANQSSFAKPTDQNMGVSAQSDQPQVAGIVATGDVGESPAALQARTVPAFATDLSIELAALDASQASAVHILHIPTLGLRLPTTDTERWAQKLQDNRAQLIRQLMQSLANAQYLKLLDTDGELYLKQLIEATLSNGLGLEKLAQTGLVEPSRLPRSDLEALLPLSYSVR